MRTEIKPEVHSFNHERRCEMEEKNEKKSCCNAPCIINASQDFSLVFCQKDPGHLDEHSCEIQDHYTKSPITVSWSYIGRAEDGDNWAPSMTERCKTWAHISSMTTLTSDCLVWSYSARPHAIRENSSVGFCCEETSPHEKHMRSGIYGPLGIKWRIEW